MKRHHLLKHLKKHGAVLLREGSMKYRAVIKKTGVWWIGWLIDLPGVNAQEKTKKKLIESLRIGAEEMLAAEIPFEPNSEMTTIEIPDPKWVAESVHG